MTMLKTSQVDEKEEPVTKENSAPESIEVEVAPENGSNMPPGQHFNKEILEDEPRTSACSSKSTQRKTKTLELELEKY